MQQKQQSRNSTVGGKRFFFIILFLFLELTNSLSDVSIISLISERYFYFVFKPVYYFIKFYPKFFTTSPNYAPESDYSWRVQGISQKHNKNNKKKKGIVCFMTRLFRTKWKCNNGGATHPHFSLAVVSLFNKGQQTLPSQRVFKQLLLI